MSQCDRNISSAIVCHCDPDFSLHVDNLRRILNLAPRYLATYSVSKNESAF